MGIISDLRQSVTDHPLKAEFRALGVRQIEVATHMNLSLSGVAHILGGYRRPSAAQEAKLQALAAKVRREREKEAGGRENA